MVELAAAIAVAVLAATHLLAGHLRRLEGVPRSRWLSAGGGISVAYVFVHLLPELAERQEALAAAAEGVVPAIERHAYVVALVGMAVFYGVELHSRRAPTRDRGRTTGSAAFRTSMASFATYNALVGYTLLTRAEEGSWSLALFTLAMALHFLVNDHALREHHKDSYRRVGRWLLAGGALLGYGAGLLVTLPEPAIAVVLAFIAGGVVLNVLKEELPEDRRSSYSAFVAGAAAYAALLLAVG